MIIVIPSILIDHITNNTEDKQLYKGIIEK